MLQLEARLPFERSGLSMAHSADFPWFIHYAGAYQPGGHHLETNYIFTRSYLSRLQFLRCIHFKLSNFAVFPRRDEVRF